MTETRFEAAAHERRRASVRDYVELTKPRIMALAVFTAVAGHAAAPTPIEWVGLVGSSIFIALGAGGAGAYNMAFEHRTDPLMRRTMNRPVAAGRITPATAIIFATALAVIGVAGLFWTANVLAAALLALTIFYYAVIYTLILKRRTSLNIVIGGAAGALPPVIGWATATAAAPPEAWALFLVVLLWTPPHSWALALFCHGDYARAGIPMLPVVRGAAETRLQIWLYSLVLLPVAVAPVFLKVGGALYGLVAGPGGLAFLLLAWKVYRSQAGESPDAAPREMHGTAMADAADRDRPARVLFFYSIFWLFALFSALLLEGLA